jgi:hypothetical protein
MVDLRAAGDSGLQQASSTYSALGAPVRGTVTQLLFTRRHYSRAPADGR